MAHLISPPDVCRPRLPQSSELAMQPSQNSLLRTTLPRPSSALRALRAGLLAAGFTACSLAHLHAQTSWNLVFEDDFNGTSVDTTQWSLYNGTGNGGFGLRSPSAFSVSGGNLVVTAQMVNGNLVSGGMAHKLNYKYGKFEFRVRTEADPSTATSGVVLTWPQSGNWPIDGENDMYETGTGSSRNPFHTYIHYGANNSQHSFTHNADGTQWHIMAMEWSPTAIKMYRDDALVWTMTDTNAIPDVYHHLCIQLDAFKSTMTGVVHMYVDWVKIYQACYEAENLTVAGSSGDTVRVFSDPNMSNRAGSIIDATATGDYVTYTLPGVAAGSYDVRVGVKKYNTRGIFQLSVSGVGTGSSNVGATQDLYSSVEAYTELDLGAWSPGSTSDKYFKFAVTGKNANSSGYTIAVDYIKLLPQ